MSLEKVRDVVKVGGLKGVVGLGVRVEVRGEKFGWGLG